MTEDKMAYAVEKVFTPDIYKVEFGGRTVIIEPLPSGKAKELLSKIRNVRPWIDNFQAEIAELNTIDAVVLLVTKGLEQPYNLLKYAIPNLTQEEVDSEPIKKIFWLIELIVKQNGFDWALEMLKNWFRQLGAQIPMLIQTFLVNPNTGQETNSTLSSEKSAEPIAIPQDTLSTSLPSPNSSTSSARRRSGRGEKSPGT